MRLGDLALDSMCSQQGLEIQGQESASVPESLIFGDKTLFFLSHFLSYIFLTFFSFSKFLLPSSSVLFLPCFRLLPVKCGCCMLSICHTDVLSFKLGHQVFSQKD